MTQLLPFAAAAVAVSLAACDHASSYQGSVTVELEARSVDTGGGQLIGRRSIESPAGDPYGAFVSGATDALGAAPGQITVSSCTLALASDSTGVASLDQVVTDLGVSFSMNHPSVNDSYDVARATHPTGAGPDDLAVHFDGFAAADLAAARSGDFAVAVDATPAPGFATADADAFLELAFELDAAP
jgi:hypothetical protein